MPFDPFKWFRERNRPTPPPQGAPESHDDAAQQASDLSPAVDIGREKADDAEDQEREAEDAMYASTLKSLPVSRILTKDEEAKALGAGYEGLRLVPVNGRLALATPESKLFNPRSTALYRHDLFVFRIRGTFERESVHLASDTRAGTLLHLIREPANKFDANAIALSLPGRSAPLGYMNKLNAKRLAKRIDNGEQFVAITLAGSPVGNVGESVQVLVTRPDMLAHLQRPAPALHIGEGVDPEGRWIISDDDVFAHQRWADGTPPVHGLSKRHRKSDQVASVRLGDTLQVLRNASAWRVYDRSGLELGTLRWHASDVGKKHASLGIVLFYPSAGTLVVTKVYAEGDRTVDFGGYVVPVPADSGGDQGV